MGTIDAEAFLERLETDDAFAATMQAAGGDPDATHRLAAEAGYSFTHDEMLEALANVYGVELTLEQLEQIAAGDAGHIIVSASVTAPLYGSVMMGAAAG
ncbi:Nif11-like leader peptide family RiPP precursor [Nocardioides agariphilus]|jgi:predicted ribosomally synthesized peptide with nif11-like leader|uniref:Nif11-like leader peptide family RiPP n=1 Tax=Nocardioides agariphilus TaxID=433664 RepID=A0A930VN21_9ACTN|nr:Nif11-like leader peptide family RiPP precursor [Nocardioides agariphilus]MBF4769667.1 Nif11-like leader peptide family RiPP precursor [Nocardioides agariphilus]